MDVTQPRIHILDRRFKYTPASKTDLARTFERARRALATEKSKPDQAELAKAQDE